MSGRKETQQDADEKQGSWLFHHWGTSLGPLGLRKTFDFFATRFGNAHLNTGFEQRKTPSGFSMGRHGVLRAFAQKKARGFSPVQ